MVDTSNPMLQLGLMGMLQPNQYSHFNNMSFPMPPPFRGAATDAMGRPISPSAGASSDPTQAYLDALANPGPMMTPGAIAGQAGPIYQGGPPTPTPAMGGFIPPAGPAAAAAPAAAPAGSPTTAIPGAPYSGGGGSPWVSPGASGPSPAQQAWAQLSSGAFAGPSKGGMAGMGEPIWNAQLGMPTWPGVTLNSVPQGK